MPIVTLATNWWSLVLRGLAGIALGALTFLWPGITFVALVLLFGAYALVDGILCIVGAIWAAEAHQRWAILLIEGLVGILAAAVTFLWPGISALALVYVIASWALVTGVFEIVAAVRLRRNIEHEWLLVLSGVASLILGIVMAFVPLAGALAIAYWLGAYAFVFGVLLFVLGLRLRQWTKHVPGGPSIPQPAY